MSITEIISILAGALPTGYFFGRSKMKAEVTKLIAETQTLTDNHEIRLSEFYKKEVFDLMQEIKSLREELEEDKTRCRECFENIERLSHEYEILKKEIHKLKS